jgi:hypothetical protein
MTTATDLLVDRTDLRDSRLQSREIECGDGEVLFEIERFALTANNITYAVAGDSAFGYWKFFPAPDHWGRVPVWGFARVSLSKHPDVAVGERFYGYFPMATHLVVVPQRVGSSGFVDGVPHRAALPPVYNHYQRAGGERRDEIAQMLLRPLFMTSFLLDDFLADNHFFGARRVILSSASSKTSLGLAFELAHKRKGRVTVTGLTAPKNVEFVRRLGFYDEVVTYTDLESLDTNVPSVLVDMAGNADVLRRVHEHLADALRHSCTVGATHWQDAARTAPTLPGPQPAMFFAPSHIQKRNKEWGAGGLERHLAPDWLDFVADSARWFEVVEHRGPAAMQRAYLEMLEGSTPPNRGILIAPAG